MRGSFIAMGALSVAFWAGSYASALAPPAHSPDSQQSAKGAKSAKSSSADHASKQAAPDAGADQNPFPEAVSQRAAEAKQQQAEAPAASHAAKSSSSDSSGNANPFPEAVSRKAAQAAQSKQSAAGYSSSQSSSLTSGLAGGEASSNVSDPARAKKDLEVAHYYMGSGDYRGAYLRYKDAVKYDKADLKAIFGLAQSARKIGKYDEAARNYHIYLVVAPKGSKAKDARKALSQMAGK